MPAATLDHSQRICEVWANNLDEELKRIRQVIRKYNYIAMVSSHSWRKHMKRSAKECLMRLYLWHCSRCCGKWIRLFYLRCVWFCLQDTEFPGVVARPIGEFRSNADYQYQLLRCNVDLLKIIQLGLTFMNEQGEYPPGTSTWQFNFKFNLT